MVVYDLMGHEVIKWENNYEDAGDKQVIWNGTDANEMPVSSGIYLYRLTARSMESDRVFIQNRKMLLLKMRGKALHYIEGRFFLFLF